MKMRLVLFYLCFASLGFAQNKQKPQQYVVLVSFDGFRHDYVKLYNTPNFDKLIKKGVSAKSLIPSFPSKTFPNHYTLVTGLYPAHHGLVDNNFLDRDRAEVYTMSKRALVQDDYYYGGQPLWQYVHKFGLKSASYFWVGSEAPINGSYPDYYYQYDGSVSNEQRIKQVTKWLKLPADKRPQFISLYFSLVDSQGHRNGPVSAGAAQAVEEADRLLGKLMKQISKNDLAINLIVVSDHGMRQLANKQETFLQLDDFVDLNSPDYKVVNSGTHAQVYFSDSSKIDELFNGLSNQQFIKVYKKGKFPEHCNYNVKSNRIGDLIITTAENNKVLSIRNWSPGDSDYIGVHGYDPIIEDMHGIFYAKGPAFKNGIRTASFENIHVYPLICQILGIPIPDDIDGTIEKLSSILK
jgi:predicted AlkP superfamily pyrophosphatase or phosphodiesterase